MYSVSAHVQGRRTVDLCTCTGKSDERKEEQGKEFVRNGGRKDVISGVGVKNGPVTMMTQSRVPPSSPMLLTATGAAFTCSFLLSVANASRSSARISTASTRATCTSSSLRMSKRSHDEATASREMMMSLGTMTFGRSNLQFIEDRPMPKLCSPDDVLIRVLYSDLNPVDHHKVRLEC